MTQRNDCCLRVEYMFLTNIQQRNNGIGLTAPGLYSCGKRRHRISCESNDRCEILQKDKEQKKMIESAGGRSR